MKAILLLAGDNTRFFPLHTTHKSLVTLYGAPLIEHLIRDLILCGIKDFVLITRENDTETLPMINRLPAEATFEVMTIPRADGIGEAVKVASKNIDETFLYINSYHVVGQAILAPIIEYFEAHSELDGLITGIKEDRIEEYGALVLEGDHVKGIVEKPKREDAPSFYKASLVMIFKKDFFEALNSVTPHQDSFEEAVSVYCADHKVEMYKLNDPIPSLKYAWNIFDFKEMLSERYGGRISPQATIAQTALVEPTAIIEEGAVISDHAHIRGNTYIGKNSFIGDYTLVRDSDVGENVVIGTHQEVARSVIMKDTHIHGGGYIGDSIIGENCRIAYGLITANKRIDRQHVRTVVKGQKVDTHRKSFGIALGNESHIGINVSTMPGVLIAPQSVIMPSTTLTKNQP